jgi:hypothetical protein
MNIDNFQDIGYAERYIEAETTPNFPLATLDELERAYVNAEAHDGIAALVRGETYELNFVPSNDLLNTTKFVWDGKRVVPTGNNLAFRLDLAGRYAWAVPCRSADGAIVDLIAGRPFDDRGRMKPGEDAAFLMTTGRGAIVEFDALKEPWSASNPCPVVYDVNLFLDETEGVLVLRRSAKELLRLASHVRLRSWDEASELADLHFEDDRERVSGPQDREAYEGYLERQVRAELEPVDDWMADSWSRFNAKITRQDAARDEGVIRRRPSKWTAAAKVQRKTKLLGGAL